jgi:transcription initiation factor TFIIB
MPLVDPAKYIVRVANNLSFDEKAKRRALNILEEARKKNILVGKDPTSMAASILYLVNLAGQNPKTQADIAKAAGITEVTVRNRSKELVKRLGIDNRQSARIKRNMTRTDNDKSDNPKDKMHP